MQVRTTLSANAEELAHRTTRNPSSSSTPLMGNQNLDDVMQGRITFKNSLMASGSLKRPILAIRTVSPLVHQVNDNASPTPPMRTRHNLDPVPKFRGSLRDMDLKTDVSPVNGHGWKGKPKTENSFQQRTKQRKRDEPIISTKIKDILEWRTMKPETVERQYHGNAKQTEKATGGIRDLWKRRRPKNKGPKAGQVYEIVNQHIIEDSMDRTVTISTWRERVDEGCDLDTDTASVYYVSPGGYAREDAHMAEVNTNLGRRRLLGSRHGSKTEKQSSRPYPQPVETYSSRGPESSTTAKSRADYRHAQYFDIGRADPLGSKNTAFSASDNKKHTSSRTKEGGVPIHPARDPLAQLKVPDGPFTQRQHHYQESTPIEKELPTPPFHPTRSGSTISSIRSASTTEFEKFLDGCKPSLVHVSGMLNSLGMYKLEHLKAVARLSPEMRDREVKEVALRLGMTVVEWAILVDELLRRE